MRFGAIRSKPCRTQAMVGKRRRLGALSLVFLVSFWLLEHARRSDAALQQPLALRPAEPRRKLRDEELPTYVIEWVMPGASRSVRTSFHLRGGSGWPGKGER